VVRLKQNLLSPISQMDRLLAFSLQHRSAIFALAIAALVAGFAAASRLQTDASGAQLAPSAQLVVGYPGHSAEEVETTIAVPIENALRSLPQVKTSSVSRPDWAVITLSFAAGADEAQLRGQVFSKIEKMTLPREVNFAMVRPPPD
jgi:multidrug efflux pump subunit AcrB